MKTCDRRQLLFGAAALSVLPRAAASDPLSAGQLVAVGFGAKRSSREPLQGTSVITRLRLVDGNVQQHFIPQAFAHTFLATREGGICLPQDGVEAACLDQEMRLIRHLVAPQGYLFSGHGVLATEGTLGFVSLRRQTALTPMDNGRIAVIDVKRWKILGTMDSGGIRPHDMSWDQGRLVISHYGDFGAKREPRLVTMDARSGQLLQVVNTPAVGSLTHFAVGEAGRVCAVPLHYYDNNEAGRRAVEKDLGAATFEMSVGEDLENRLGAPMPILLIQDGKVEALRGEPAKQRRAQSVAFHPGTRRFFIAYAFSDQLACVDGSKVSYVSAFDLGLNLIRGVCPLGHSNLIAVTGEFRGVALIDAESLQLVKRFDVNWYDHAHVSYSA